MQFLRRQWFILGLAAALGLGFLFAPAGRAVNTGGVAADVAVVLIFLGTGFTLPTDAIRRGLANVRLHLYIQLFIFVGVPGYIVLTNLLLGRPFGPVITAGLFALAVLPTTISTCTVFTNLSGGNTVATMFNAALGNMLGVFISPLLLSLLLQGSGAAIPASRLAGILGSLALQMLLPTVAGQALRRLLAACTAAPGPAARGERSGSGDRAEGGEPGGGGEHAGGVEPGGSGERAGGGERSAAPGPVSVADRAGPAVRTAQSALILLIVFFAV
ncbi:MAG: bile acid:sodium symporter, partial [bacterium]